MNAHETAQMCYRMAYFVLPQYVQHDPEKVASELTSGRIGAMFFFVMTCQIGGQELQEEDAQTIQAFRAHTGRLNDDWDYYVVEYPPPPPLDLSVDLESDDPAKIMEAMQGIVLAPYFSAMVRSQTQAARYFVLGQSLDGFTTLRTVTPDINANLGRGCEPQLLEFVKLLRSHVEGSAAKPVAAIVTGRKPRKRWWEFWK